jgi:hypothetical protein
MIEIIYTNNKGISLTIPSTDYNFNKIIGLENPVQEIFLQKSPGINGAQFIGSLYNIRELSLDGAISSGTLEDMYTKRAYINRVINDQNIEGSLQINITTSTGVISYQINTIAAQIRFAPKDASIPTARFNIGFKCANPFLNILPAKSETLGITTPGLTFPVTFPTVFSTSTGSNTAIINNTGNVDAGLLLTVTGPSVNPIITNQKTGEYLKFVGLTLGIGQVMTIQTGRINQITVNTGTGDNNGFQFLDLNSRFFNVVPGNNTITIYDDLGFNNGTCVLSWYDQLTGV